MYSINNISFDTDGAAVKVPPEKGNGKITLATSEDFEVNREEYMLYNAAHQNTKEDVEKTSGKPTSKGKEEGIGIGE